MLHIGRGARIMSAVAQGNEQKPEFTLRNSAPYNQKNVHNFTWTSKPDYKNPIVEIMAV